MDKVESKPILGISSLIIVLSFPLLGLVYNSTEIGFLEIFEWGTMLGWFCIGTGLAIASLLKERSKKVHLILPILTIIISALMILMQLDL
ncbi:hypothetical protein D0436_04375 [Shewanella decolorationis]|uniref:Uncharacterized protein n=1 Tax=Shewanella decolorationis TaxID=256839 RepID=A0A5B8QTM5_9GAMM|nr:hypothetical protein [Shewanella decolorationis]QDZ89768.1 hypothetical protein D0436_04375 [Shewanella decolorationis]